MQALLLALLLAPPPPAHAQLPRDTKMAPPAPTPITQTELIQTNAAMLALTSLFIFARIGIHIVRRKALELHDVLIYSAYVLYLALWICYRIVIGPMFRAYAVYTGERPPYPALMHDASQMLRLITAAQMCFYTVLLCVKLSLLTLYRKLLKGLPIVYGRIWWAMVSVVVLVSGISLHLFFKHLLISCSLGSAVCSAAYSPATILTRSSIAGSVAAHQTKLSESYSLCILHTQ